MIDSDEEHFEEKAKLATPSNERKLVANQGRHPMGLSSLEPVQKGFRASFARPTSLSWQ